jgi:hypothetical protein
MTYSHPATAILMTLAAAIVYGGCLYMAVGLVRDIVRGIRGR